MIQSVSSINFKANNPVNHQDLINSPGQFTLKAEEAKPDGFEKTDAQPKEKKGTAGKVIGTIVALAAAAYIALGIAVNKKVLTRVPAEGNKTLKTMDNVKNFFFDIGESGNKLWQKVFNKKAADTTKTPPTDAK